MVVLFLQLGKCFAKVGMTCLGDTGDGCPHIAELCMVFF